MNLPPTETNPRQNQQPGNWVFQPAKPSASGLRIAAGVIAIVYSLPIGLGATVQWEYVDRFSIAALMALFMTVMSWAFFIVGIVILVKSRQRAKPSARIMFGMAVAMLVYVIFVGLVYTGYGSISLGELVVGVFLPALAIALLMNLDLRRK